MANPHIQTLFGPPEDGYQPSPDLEPGDEAWRRLRWVLWPIGAVAIFMHGPGSEAFGKIFWILFVMGLLITNEWSQLGSLRTRVLLVVAFVVHVCIVTVSIGHLPEHRRLTAIILISLVESILLGLPIRLMNLKKDG